MIQYNTFKTGGVIYKITDVIFVGKNKDFPKRELWLEVPTTRGVDQRTELFKFEVVGDDAGSLDYMHETAWVDMVFKIEGRIWKNPEGKEILFTSLKIIDAKEGPNPFDEKKELMNTPDDLSNTISSSEGDQVKDWNNPQAVVDVNQGASLPFDDGDVSDLPF